MVNNTISIYKNYGVLGREKCATYTYGAESETAACSDKITVKLPEGWELYESASGEIMVTSPWGWDYDINHVLMGDIGPVFYVTDRDQRTHVLKLEIIEP